MSTKSDPASGFGAVTPSDTVPFEGCRSLFVGTGGNLTVKGGPGGTTLFKNVANGTILPIQVTQVMATNTTAADIVALR